MSKTTIMNSAILVFATIAVVCSYLAASPVFPGFYSQYVTDGVHPIIAFFYAWSSAAGASRWVSIVLIALIPPFAWWTKRMMDRFGK